MNADARVRLEMARMVAQRLERLSADSEWAHVASGYRGALIKMIDQLERLAENENPTAQEMQRLDVLTDKGFDLLAKAAREMGDPELILGLAPRSRY